MRNYIVFHSEVNTIQYLHYGKGDRHTLVLVGHLVEALFLHLRGHLYVRQLPLDQILRVYFCRPVHLKVKVNNKKSVISSNTLVVG